MTRAAGLATLILCAALLLTSFRPEPEYAFDPPPARLQEPRLTPLVYGMDVRFQAVVAYYCDETGVPVWVAARMFGQESVGNPLAGVWNTHAVSWLGAQGLAQLMPINLGLFSMLYNDGKPVDPFDPETAIRVGLRYLADLHSMTGSWRLAVMSYNGGAGHWTNPHRWGDWQPETVAYVRAILGG